MKSILGKTLLIIAMASNGIMHGMNTPKLNFSEMLEEDFMKVARDTLSKNQQLNYDLRLAELNAEKNNAVPNLVSSGSNITAPSPRRISSLPDLEGGVDVANALDLKKAELQKPSSVPSSPVPDTAKNSGSSSSTTSSALSSAASSTSDLASLDKMPKKDDVPQVPTHSESKLNGILAKAGIAAGVAVIVWTTTETILAYKNISQEEWDNAKQLHNKLELLAKRTGNAMLSRPKQGLNKVVSAAQNIRNKILGERK